MAGEGAAWFLVSEVISTDKSSWDWVQLLVLKSSLCSSLFFADLDARIQGERPK